MTVDIEPSPLADCDPRTIHAPYPESVNVMLDLVRQVLNTPEIEFTRVLRISLESVEQPVESFYAYVVEMESINASVNTVYTFFLKCDLENKAVGPVQVYRKIGDGEREEIDPSPPLNE